MNKNELITGVSIFLLLSFVLIYYDAFEVIHDVTRKYEEWELDEIIVISVSSIIGLLVTLLLILRRRTKELEFEKEITLNASEAKTQMVITVNHELRTPLTSIKGAIGYLVDDMDQKFDHLTCDLLELINRNVHRLNTIIEDTLSIERISNNIEAFNCAEVSANRLVRIAFDENQMSGLEKGVSLSISGPGTDQAVFVDEGRVIQIFGNLISNAANYTNADDHIEIGCRPNEDAVVFFVEDHGPGIPHSFERHVFERFTRVNASQTGKNSGTGLGLSISKAIAEAHGGSMWYESEPGKRTTFYFKLPNFVAGAAEVTT